MKPKTTKASSRFHPTVSTLHDTIRFGSSGLRGPYPDPINPSLALDIGHAAAQMADTVVIARDARTTGPALEHALKSGLLNAGADVTTLGMAPTPILAYAARDHDLGIVITASHNPAPDNGFKFWNPDGSALRGEDRDTILQHLQNPPPSTGWDDAGTLTHDETTATAYQDQLLDQHGPLEGNPRILIDPGNGATSHLSPRLLREAGASVMTLNAHPDGTFPSRPSEPNPENLRNLAQATKQTDAILGLAHDGDGDRVAAVTEDGHVLQGDHLIVLLARALHAQKIAVPVNTSRLVWDALPDTTIETTRVGDTFISETLHTTQGDFGGEPSGSMVFPQTTLCPDGLHAALLIAHIAARHDGLTTLLEDLPTYATHRDALPCPNHEKERAMERIQPRLETLGEITTLDGVRLDTDEGWALVRPSGTEPKIRITAEAKNDADAEHLITLLHDIAEQALHEEQTHA